MAHVGSTRPGNSVQLPEAAIRIEDLERVYHLEGEDIRAVNDVSFDVWPDQMTAVVGRSGSGKTTLLNLIAGLDTPTDGEVIILGQSINTMDEAARLALRRDKRLVECDSLIAGEHRLPSPDQSVAVSHRRA